MNLIFALRLGGLIHLSILVASALAPRLLNWKAELQKLPLFSRQVIWAHGIFLVFIIIGFGLVSLFEAPALAGHTMLARSLCGFIAFFWFARLCMQRVLDAKPALTTRRYRVGYRILPLPFFFLALIYGWAALAS